MYVVTSDINWSDQPGLRTEAYINITVFNSKLSLLGWVIEKWSLTWAYINISPGQSHDLWESRGSENRA